MSVTDPIEFDLDRIDALIAKEEAVLEPKHRASIEYRKTAERTIAGGVASSWSAPVPRSSRCSSRRPPTAERVARGGQRGSPANTTRR